MYIKLDTLISSDFFQNVKEYKEIKNKFWKKIRLKDRFLIFSIKMSHSFNIFFKLTLVKNQLARIEIIHQKIFKKSRKKSGLIK